MNYNYGDIIEYIDGTFDENFNKAQKWANDHNTTFDERLDLRNLPKRYFQIGEEYIPPEPTHEEQRQKRAMAYQLEVDPMTNQIQRLRDATEPDQEKIDELIAGRDAKVIEIQERYPYPDEN